MYVYIHTYIHTYIHIYPVLSKLKNVLSEIHFLLGPDRERGKVFVRIPIVGFRRAKSMKDVGSCRSCGGTRSKICKYVVTIETFRSFGTQREYCIKPDNLNCCSNSVVHLSYKTCSKEYTGSTESF